MPNPKIEPRENGPLVVKGEVAIEAGDGTVLEARPVAALCRCGRSANKPYCDGSHVDAGFVSSNETENRDGRVFAYEGSEVTVHFNKLLCGHAAECGRLNRAVFDVSQKPWVQPDKGSVESISEVITACPSGALTMKETGHLITDEVKVRVQKNGPYWVTNIELDDAQFAESATQKKYILCRCGLSKNKPFCDGTHRDEKWRDDA